MKRLNMLSPLMLASLAEGMREPEPAVPCPPVEGRSALAELDELVAALDAMGEDVPHRVVIEARRCGKTAREEEIVRELRARGIEVHVVGPRDTEMIDLMERMPGAFRPSDILKPSALPHANPRALRPRRRGQRRAHGWRDW